MAHIINDDAFVTAYDTRTGEKLRGKVPRAHLDIFPHLSLTPKAKAADQPKPSGKPTKLPEFIESKKEG